MKNLHLLVIYTIICLMLTVNTSAKPVVTDGLVSYWTFDQGTFRGSKVKDVWGDNDATLVGSPDRVEGYVKGGLKFDGKNDYVKLPNVGNFGKQIGEYTFEVWFKTTYSENWSAIYRVLEKACVGENNGTGILLNAMWFGNLNVVETKQNSILFERSRIFRDNICIGTASARNFLVSNGRWHQIVYTTQSITEEDKQKHVNFPKEHEKNCFSNHAYVDTVHVLQQISCSFPADFLAFVAPIFLGAENNSGKASRFFTGVLDEVRIYDRALTAEEVKWNYESGIGLGVEAGQKLPTVWGALKGGR